jgi:hypothetical protein
MMAKKGFDDFLEKPEDDGQIYARIPAELKAKVLEIIEAENARLEKEATGKKPKKFTIYKAAEIAFTLFVDYYNDSSKKKK